ncbi:hypothetical protein EDB87DRAFT_1736143 [Lactarius vividus]|nr:hypothetical protein EDB87DRAFT_1736143 [Lactarius vividus]
MVRLLFVSLFGLQGALALSTFSPGSKRGADAVPFVNPTLAGGSLLDRATPTLGEPLNLAGGPIGRWLSKLCERDRIRADPIYQVRSECLGIHIGDPQAANLGDGHGYVNQTIELRQDFGNVPCRLVFGEPCRRQPSTALPPERSHRQYWCIVPCNVFEGHTISPDGYNIGRDKFVQGALGASGYHTVAQNITGLLAPGSAGINHGIATDGIVVLLTVTTA